MGGRDFELRALRITSCSPVYYLLQRAVPRLQKLNPNVAVSAGTENIDDKPDNFFVGLLWLLLVMCGVIMVTALQTCKNIPMQCN